MGITNSTISGNLAVGAEGGYVQNVAGSAFGGGIFNSGIVSAVNTTIHGNTAKPRPKASQVFLNPGNGFGGGVYNSGTLNG